MLWLCLHGWLSGACLFQALYSGVTDELEDIYVTYLSWNTICSYWRTGRRTILIIFISLIKPKRSLMTGHRKAMKIAKTGASLHHFGHFSVAFISAASPSERICRQIIAYSRRRIIDGHLINAASSLTSDDNADIQRRSSLFSPAASAIIVPTATVKRGRQLSKWRSFGDENALINRRNAAS